MAAFFSSRQRHGGSSRPSVEIGRYNLGGEFAKDQSAVPVASFRSGILFFLSANGGQARGPRAGVRSGNE
jgi:hypothetical protein